MLRGLVRLRRVRRHVHVPVPDLAAPVHRVRRAVSSLARNPSVEGISPEAARHARRNFRLGVTNGILLTLVDGLFAPSIVLALFVVRLGGSNLLVGLLPAIATGGWFLPQVFIAGRVQGQLYVMRWYRATALVRSVCLILLTMVTFSLGGNPGLLLGAFFLLYTVYSLAGGISGIPWLEMVGKMIPPRRRGTFFSLRSFWGGLLAMLASGFLAALLAEKAFGGLAFPMNFAVLFGVVTVLATAGFVAWMSMREPKATVTAKPITMRALMRRGRELLRVDHEYRSFTIVRILLALATIADPFYAVFAKTVLGAPNEVIGLYVAASAGAGLASNFIWGPLGDRASNRTLMTVTAISVALVPLSALVIPLLGMALSAAAVSTVFAAVFVFQGLAAGSARIVNNNMLLTIAPAAERATYIGFLNTVLGLVTFIPPLGGAVVDAVGYVALFVFALVIAASALFATTRMSTQRVEG
jgi:MFS family permease